MPKGWVVCRLSDILFARTGATFNKGDAISQQAENYIRILRGGNIEPYKITYKDDDLFISSEKVRNNILLQQYDIITPAVTSLENIGKMACYIQPVNDQMTVGGFVYLLTPYLCDLAYSQFILYQLTSPIFIKSLRSISKKSGAAFYNINKEKLNNLPFYLPPYAEQVRIVEFIDALFEQVELIENNQSDIKKLHADLKKKTLDLAIQGKLVPHDPNDEPASELLKRIRAEKKAQLGKKYADSYIYKGDDNCYYEKIGNNDPVLLEHLPFEIPDSWAWARLGNLGDWGAGATPPRKNPEFYNGSIIWIKTGELKNGYIYSSEETVTEKALQNCSLRYNNIGDILIAMYGATIGKLGIAGVRLTTNQACCVCTPCDGFYNLYLFYFLMAEKDRFIKLGAGGAQPNISREKIINHLIPLPPYNEQIKIVNQLKIVFKYFVKDEV